MIRRTIPPLGTHEGGLDGKVEEAKSQITAKIAGPDES
jgi:hypothetical protein